MARKARALHVTGGKVYGYDNVEILATAGADGFRKRLHVIRRVNDIQARVVRRMFELCAGGSSLTRIAKTLNTEGIEPPRHAPGWGALGHS